MASEKPASATARRNRIIAIVAGTVTITAIVVAFAAEYFELPWKWLRPTAELLLLAELVGLVILERHQLFEPVHESVGGMRHDITRVLDSLGSITEKLNSSGQITTYIGPRELYAARLRVLREALARNEEGPIFSAAQCSLARVFWRIRERWANYTKTWPRCWQSSWSYPEAPRTRGRAVGHFG
jgi:hypothetical protein